MECGWVQTTTTSPTRCKRRGRGGGQSQTRVGPTKFHHYPYPRESRGSGSFRGLCYLKYWLNRIIILMIIIIMSIFKEDNVFSMIDSLPYGPPVTTDIDYYRTFSGLVLQFWFVRYLLGEEKPVLAL